MTPATRCVRRTRRPPRAAATTAAAARVAVAAAAALLVLAPSPAGACSMAPYPSVRVPRVVHFVGTAEPDTVATDPGDLRYRTGMIAPPGRERTAFFGQAVALERIGASAPPEVQRAVAGGARRAVLVPWSYGPDCTPTPWPAAVSTRWVAPGTRGLFTGVLRDRAHWVAPDVPTLDVVHFGVYPGPYEEEWRQARVRYGGPGADTAALTPEQLLLLYDHVPDVALLKTNPAAATEPLRRWARDHPGLAARHPAKEIVYSALIEAEDARVRAIRSPVAGTYRFALLLPRGDSVVFFARTTLRPTSTLDRVSDRDPQLWEQHGPPHMPGYYLTAVVARTRAELPLRTTSNDGLPDPASKFEGYVAVVEAPVVATRDSTVWRGSVDLLGKAVPLLPAGALRERAEAAGAAEWEMLERGERSYAPGRFVKRPDGSVHYELVLRDRGARALTLRGTRVALDCLAERR